MTNTIYRRWRLFSPAAVAMALAPAALVVMASITSLSFKAMDETPKATYADCLAIKEPASRLACYDTLAQAHPMPAKGGLAIISSPQP